MEEKWLEWSKKLQAIAQIGRTFSENPYDIERYEEIEQIALDIMSEASGVEMGVLKPLFVPPTGYVTPKVDLRAAVFNTAQQILLVKETADGLWTLPGGWADVCEPPSLGIEREVLEESGYIVKVRKLAAVLDRSLHDHEPPFPYHIYKHFFICDLLGGEAKISHETAAVDFFGRDEIPPLSTSRVLPKQIELMFDHYLHPERPTVYD